MDETVNEPLVFEESDFADDQTTDTSSPAVEETNEQPTSENNATDSTEDSTNANESQTVDEIAEMPTDYSDRPMFEQKIKTIRMI